MRVCYAKEAWFDGDYKLKDYVHVDDLLTRLHQAIGPNFNHLFTGVQLYNEVMKTVRTAFNNGCSVYVAVADDSDNVPREKGETQAERSQASPIKPYDVLDGFAFTDAGIRADSGTAEEKVDIRRLMATRSMRKRFFQFVADKALAYETLPDGKTFIFDFDSRQHPLILPKHRDVPDEHVLGEADLGVFYWAEHFCEKDVVFTTVDTDIIPIATDYVYSGASKRPTSTKLIWKYEKNGYVDIRMMLSKTLKHLRLTPTSFKLLCVLSGTDFFNKATIMFKFGVEKITNAVQTSSGYWEDTGARFDRSDNARNALMIILFDLYGKWVKGCLGKFLDKKTVIYEDVSASTSSTSSTSSTNKRKPEEGDDTKEKTRIFDWIKFESEIKENQKFPKSFKLPNEYTVEKAANRISWNLRYWTAVPAEANTTVRSKTSTDGKDEEDPGKRARTSKDEIK